MKLISYNLRTYTEQHRILINTAYRYKEQAVTVQIHFTLQLLVLLLLLWWLL
jgi:hypothetical protein